LTKFDEIENHKFYPISRKLSYLDGQVHGSFQCTRPAGEPGRIHGQRPDFYNLEFINAQRPERREAAKLQAERWRETAARRRHRLKDTFFTIEKDRLPQIEPIFKGVNGGALGGVVLQGAHPVVRRTRGEGARLRVQGHTPGRARRRGAQRLVQSPTRGGGRSSAYVRGVEIVA